MKTTNTFFREINADINERVQKAVEEDNLYELNSLLSAGASNHETLQKLLAVALNTAAKNNKINIAEYLVNTKKADINSRNRGSGKTPLMIAVIANHIEFTKWLLEKKAMVDCQNYYGNTVLHLVNAYALDNHFIDILLKSGCDSLLNIKNIYGETPRDVSRNMNVKTTIHQKNIKANMLFYLDHHKRDKALLDQDGIGLCAGLDFLYLMYATNGQKDYFFNTLSIISCWDRSPEELYKDFEPHMPQAKFYKNPNELLNQWTNDVIAFQKGIGTADLEGKTRWKNQLERSKQYEIMRNDDSKENTIHYLYKWRWNDPNISTSATEAKILHILKIFSEMPIGTCLEIGGGKHFTAAFINKNSQICYYDSLFVLEVPPIESVDSLHTIILNTKYKALNKSPEKDLGFIFQLFYFPEDQKYFKNFNRDDLYAKLQMDGTSKTPCILM